MLFGIDYSGPLHLLITGPPGSGKTTISIMRAEKLIAERKSVLLITHHNLLWRSLKNIASPELKPHIKQFFAWWASEMRFGYLHSTDDEDKMRAAMTAWKGVDEIIFDEGQDLSARIYRSLMEKCIKMTVGADNAQKVYANGLSSDEIKKELGILDEPQHIPLGYNYRNTYGIYEFARHFLPYNEIVNNSLSRDRIPKGTGEKPTIFIVPDHNTVAAQLQILLSNAGNRNIAVLAFRIHEVEYFAKLINNLGFKCSKHHHDHHLESDEIENILVTTLQSAKGLEFQVVIMVNMETAMDEDYKTENHYFVACTRAKENLFLIVQDATIPPCMKHFPAESYSQLSVPFMAFPKSSTPDEVTPEDLPF